MSNVQYGAKQALQMFGDRAAPFCQRRLRRFPFFRAFHMS